MFSPHRKVRLYQRWMGGLQKAYAQLRVGSIAQKWCSASNKLKNSASASPPLFIVHYNESVMAVTVEFQNTGDPGLQAEVRAVVEHVLTDRPGDWSVRFIGSQENDQWNMKITGPNAFERSYTLERRSGELRAEVIGVLLGKMLPRQP